MIFSARCSSGSGVSVGTSSSRLAEIGAPARHCQAVSASKATRAMVKSRGPQCSIRESMAVRVAEQAIGLAVGQAQHGAVALGFLQLDTLHQGAALNLDGGENLLEQQAARGEVEGPVIGTAGQAQVEVLTQAAAVALEHGEKQAVLLRGGI